jgi:diguanylate cyclase (GGDEF)-like protein/PAS domain S-box-containing protein
VGPSIRHTFFPSRMDSDDLLNWRERLLSTILSVIAVLGCITSIPSMLLAVREGRWSIVLIDAIALVWIISLWRLRQLPWRFRAWNLLLLMYSLGVWFLLTVGPVSQIYLMAFPVMAALLLGLRPALCALALNAITLLGVGYLANADLHLPGFEDEPLLRWVVITINFLFVDSVITISSAVLLHRLEKSLENQRAINEELKLTSTAVTRLNDIVLITQARPLDEPGPRIIFVNDAFERRTGYTREEVMGKSPRFLQGPETSRTELDRIRNALSQWQPVRAKLVNYTKSGEPFWLELDIVPVADNQGRITHWVSVERDITERKRAEDDIHRLAYFDVLTHLPNRRLLMDRMTQLLASARRSDVPGAVLFIDLDNFKNVNDARGHAVGDILLQLVAQRLSKLMREEDTVARLGGDEFVILIARLPREHDGGGRAAMAIAEKVREALEQPFDIQGQPYNSGGSIGVSLLPTEGQTTDVLLREADTAMYRAKAAGRNRIAFFEAAMQRDVEERLALEHDLSQAISLDQLSLHLQPQVDHFGLPVSAELLLRWTHPVRGPVSPARFIPIAEDSGLILRLGDWVLEQGLRILVRLDAAGRALPLSINVSPRQFRQPDFVQRVSTLLAQTGANPSSLIFEVTEGLLIENLDATIARMNELALLGIRFSIDDFGTGYSSLAYLKRLPLYELKIDKSFIQDSPADPSDTAIVQLILSMASSLGLRVVAEGVETTEQADFLMARGCDAMQGYLYARPMPIEVWLQSGAKDMASGS